MVMKAAVIIMDNLRHATVHSKEVSVKKGSTALLTILGSKLSLLQECGCNAEPRPT